MNWKRGFLVATCVRHIAIMHMHKVWCTESNSVSGWHAYCSKWNMLELKLCKTSTLNERQMLPGGLFFRWLIWFASWISVQIITRKGIVKALYYSCVSPVLTRQYLSIWIWLTDALQTWLDSTTVHGKAHHSAMTKVEHRSHIVRSSKTSHTSPPWTSYAMYIVSI